MDAREWNRLPSDYWRFTVRRFWRTIQTATGEVIKEVVVVIAGVAAATIGALARDMDWKDAAGWGFVGGLFALFLILAFFWMIAPCQIDKELNGQLNKLTPRFAFTSLLHDRKRSIEQIAPSGDGNTFLRKSLVHLASEQEAFVKLLRRAENPWADKPNGWGKLNDCILEWVGLASVMEYRYGNGEVTPIRHLFDDTQDDNGVLKAIISPANFPMAKKVTLEVVSMVIREIENPEHPRLREPLDAFELGTRLILPGCGTPSIPARPAPRPASEI
jgi:hypothetical protein